MPSIDRRLTAMALAVLMAGCAAPSPAPVENRTRPSATAAPPAPPKPAPAQATAVAPAAVEVQAAPVRPSGLQVRPLEPAPERAGPPPRSGPVGVKRPYSEAELADARNPAATGSAASAATAPAPAPAGPQPPAAPVPQSGAAQPAAASADSRAVSAAGFAWPARGRVVQGFSAPKSMGISIAGTVGDPVTAAADGRVIFSGPGPRGYGNLVIVRHDGDTLSVYAHNRSVAVQEGQNVKRGQKLAELGSTDTDSPKLHFEIRKAGKPVDPQKLLPPR